MASRDGNGWVRCQLGHRHWGRFGAAGLLAYVTGGPVLLQHRVWWSHHGGTWGLPGGARDSHESALAAALREAAEECGVPPGAVRQQAVFTDDHGGWSYTSVLAAAAEPFAVESDYDESDEVSWVPVADVDGLPLHPGLHAHWRELRHELSPVTIIVDGANVVGSRPDGWWRDRAGAAARLRDELAPLVTEGITELPPGTSGPADADLGVPDPAGDNQRTPPVHRAPTARLGSWLPVGGGMLDSDAELAGMGDGQILLRWMPAVVLVVEGAARAVADEADGSAATTRAATTSAATTRAATTRAANTSAANTSAATTSAGESSRVRTVAARGSGDDTIAVLAAQTGGRRIVVTADRELRARCVAAGASVAGPSWLLGLL